MNFGEAINEMKTGKRAKRRGWNGKNQYIELASGISYTNTKGIPTESFIGNTVYLAINNNYMSRMDRIGKKSY